MNGEMKQDYIDKTGLKTRTNREMTERVFVRGTTFNRRFLQDDATP